ncbi:MAG: amidinotransferase, partial [Bacteroidota bacterium]
AFQPVGDCYAIVYPAGFTAFPEPLYDLYGEENIILVGDKEMYDMVPNIFSIHPELVVIEQAFARLEKELAKRGIRSLKVAYKEVSKLGGLLRCSTCPLYREDL